MSEQADRPTNGWTFHTLYQHFQVLGNERNLRYQQRFDAQEKALHVALEAAKEAVSAALLAADRAISKSESASERRFESVNEFRAQLADQAATFMPRAEANLQIGRA